MTAPHEVVIDARWLRTGIGRYILTLLRDLKPNLPDTFLSCVTMSSHAASLAPLCDRIIEMNCGIYSLGEQLRLSLAARDAVAFCAPHYNIPVFRRGPMVVTIHDVTHLLFPAYRTALRARLYANTMLHAASARATRIVTPSFYTRDCLIQHLGTDPAKICVIPCALSEAFYPRPPAEAIESVRRSHRIAAPYILFVGSTAPHKNLTALLKAHRLLSATHRDVPELVLVLPRITPTTQRDREFRLLLDLPGVYRLYGVSDESLASLYSAAVMTVVPSFEEGFGLPVIESMVCGTPVICSRTASLPEIAGDSAIYFDPGSVEELAAAIDLLLASPTLQERLVEQGLHTAAQFSGTRMASTYARVLSSVLRESAADGGARDAA